MTPEELNKACEIVRDLANEHFGDWEQSCKFEDKFHKAMTGKTNSLFEKCLSEVNPETRAEVRRNMELLTHLTWQDIAEIVVAYGYVPKLNKDGSVRPAEAVFKDTLKRFKEESK